MTHLIDKSPIVAEIKKRIEAFTKEKNQEGVSQVDKLSLGARIAMLEELKVFIDTLEVKEVDLIIHTIIAECCDWLAMNTNLSHDKIEECRNLMLTVKEEQFKIQKGE